jgi:hypothetical protein
MEIAYNKKEIKALYQEVNSNRKMVQPINITVKK